MKPPERGAPAHPGQRVAGAEGSAWQQIGGDKDKTDWPRLQVCGPRPPGPGRLSGSSARSRFARRMVFEAFKYKHARAIDYDGFIDRRPNQRPRSWRAST